MNSRTHIHSLLGLVVLASFGGSPFYSVAAQEGAEGIAKIEFVEVEGNSCLQPVVKAQDVELADYRKAEQRWLAQRYPGSRAPLRQTVLVMAPDSVAETSADAVTVQRETAEFENADGSTVTVCFDINLVQRKKGSDESR